MVLLPDYLQKMFIILTDFGRKCFKTSLVSQDHHSLTTGLE